jgi:hypothetical protein
LIVSRPLLLGVFVAALIIPSVAPAQSQQREDEIVASLAGGRVIVQVAKDDVMIVAAIDQPVESNSVPPRLMQLDGTHVGIVMGAVEWRSPADPQPIRLDRGLQGITGGPDQHYQDYPDAAARDLETIGIAFLEKLRPLVSQLHHKLDIRPDEPLFEVVIVGSAPDYGPEVWQVEYRIEQEQVAARGEYWQTRILRPRFTQLYPPEGGKRAPHTIVEARYPPDSADSPSSKRNEEPRLVALIQGADPRIARLRSSDPRFGKVLDLIDHGQAQRASATDSTDFMQAVLPLIAGGNKFFLGTIEEQRGFDWVIPPEEPVQKTDDKNSGPYKPSLRRKPTPP